jgi:uncharacterized protein YdhG (YjbR/CyaY superfamily)
MPASHPSVDAYVDALPDAVRPVFEQVRRAVREALPGAGETISYQMPTFTLGGRSVVHVAAWKHHLAVYPVPAGDPAFERELAPYRAAEGTLRFPLKQPIPVDLIARVAALLAEQRTR